MKPGSYMIIDDHFRFSGRCDPNYYFAPIEQNYASLIKDSDFWSQELASLADKVAQQKNLQLFKGKYCWTSGPCYETPSEVKFMKMLGGGVVGMSTVPEVLMARQVGIRVVGFSMATNLGAGLQKTKLSHEEVYTNAKEGMNEFISLVKDFIVEFEFKKDEDALFLSPTLGRLKTDIKPIDKVSVVVFFAELNTHRVFMLNH